MTWPFKVSRTDSKDIHQMKNTFPRNLFKEQLQESVAFEPGPIIPSSPSHFSGASTLLQTGAAKNSDLRIPHPVPGAQAWAKFWVSATERQELPSSFHPGPKAQIQLLTQSMGFRTGRDVGQGDLELLHPPPQPHHPRHSAPKARMSLRDKYTTVPTHSTRAVTRGLPKEKSKA